MNRLDNLHKYPSRVLFGKISVAFQVVEQLPTLAEISDEEEVAVVFEGFVETNARRMVDAFEDFDLIDEQFGLFDILLCYLFDSSPLPFNSLFPGFVYNSICSLAEFFRVEFVVVEDVIFLALNQKLFFNGEI